MRPKPNILFIMTDQQRWDTVGELGDWVQTPNLDRIAREGVRFSNCVTNSPVCIPARVSLATGLYPHNTRVWNNQHYQMAEETPTWMQAVRNAGYRTSVFGKTHLHPHQGDLREREYLLNAYGFDDVTEATGPRASARCVTHMTAEWDRKGLWEAYQKDFEERFSTKPHLVRPSPLGVDDYYDTYVGQQAKRHLEAYDRDEPWFCWVSFGGPHEPWDTPEPYASMYDPEYMPEPVRSELDERDRPMGQLDEKLRNAKGRLDPEDIAQMRANYAGNVTLIDDQIGEILGVIESRGELENSVIVMSSDHGEMNGDHGLIYKSYFLNGAARVPLLVRTPETSRSGTAGAVCDSPAEWFDLGPTLVELAGSEMSHTQFARSLCPVLSDAGTAHRGEAISEITGEIMILTREWKMMLNAHGEPYRLYGVGEDPDEQTNLAGLPEMEEVETELRLRVLERLVQTQVHTG